MTVIAIVSCAILLAPAVALLVRRRSRVVQSRSARSAMVAGVIGALAGGSLLGFTALATAATSDIWGLLPGWALVLGAAVGALAGAAVLPYLTAPAAERRLLRRAATGVLGLFAVVTAVVLTLGAVLFARAQRDNTDHAAFERALHIPPLAEPAIAADGTKVFDLRAAPATAELRPGTTSQTWGINGPYLAPTLRASDGDRVRVRFVNDVPEATTLHWHGMHLPAAMDGGPHQMVESGEHWTPEWVIDQPAATLWYHPHPHGRTADHVYRGLAGVFILDHPDADALGLPSEYGVDDVPLIIQDKRIDDDGTLDMSTTALDPIGFLGDEVYVNGTAAGSFEVTTRLVRLRLVNGSNARHYNMGIDDDRTYWQIAGDGGLFDRPLETRRVQLSPGERAELLVPFSPGDDVMMRSYPPELGTDWLTGRLAGGDDTFDLVRLTASGDLVGNDAVAARLLTQPPMSEPVEVREFSLNSFTEINGRTMHPGRIDLAATVDTTETWVVHNDSFIPHSFHIHDVQYRIDEVNGRPPPPHMRGLEDTVTVPPGSSIRLRVHFSDHTDSTLPYMYHCHLLAHEDAGMMGQLVVVEPGQELVPPRHE